MGVEKAAFMLEYRTSLVGASGGLVGVYATLGSPASTKIFPGNLTAPAP